MRLLRASQSQHKLVEFTKTRWPSPGHPMLLWTVSIYCGDFLIKYTHRQFGLQWRRSCRRHWWKILSKYKIVTYNKSFMWKHLTKMRMKRSMMIFNLMINHKKVSNRNQPNNLQTIMRIVLCFYFSFLFIVRSWKALRSECSIQFKTYFYYFLSNWQSCYC